MCASFVCYKARNKLRKKNEPAYFGGSFGHLKLILGRFRDACCLIFLDFLLVLTISLTRFSLIPAMGGIAVDMSQGHRICCKDLCARLLNILLAI